MIALQVTDIRSFTRHLFTQNTFDNFWISEATIQTDAALIIDGKVSSSFYSDDSDEGLKNDIAPYKLWSEVKNYCYEWVKGKRLPLYFKIILRDAKRSEDQAFINIRYEREKPILLTTGYTAKEFTMDRSDEREWDEEVKAFFDVIDIDYQVM